MGKAILKKGLGLKVVALAAVVAAVALFGAVFTQSADAVGPGEHHDLTSVDAMPFTDNQNDGVLRYEIDPNSSASGSFAFNGGQTLTCQNNDKCDRDKTAGANGVVVRVNIDDDSPTGFIIVDITNLQSGTETRQLISVSVADRVVKITAVTDAKAIAFNDATGTKVRAHLTNNEGDGVNGKSVVVFTTLGVLKGCGTPASGNVQACSEDTANGDHDGSTETAAVDGTVLVTLLGTSRAGVATVTFTMGDLTTSVDVVLYGQADSISAEPQQSSVAIGGSTYIVVTAIDAGGNPVADHTVALAASETSGPDGVDGPTENSNEIAVIADRDYDMDGDRAVDKGDIPACDNQEAGDHQVDGAGTNLEAPAGTDVGAGTNAAGMCVLRVDAPADLDTTTVINEAATRGTHTVTIGGPAADGSKNISVTIQVGGPPSQINSDAPANVDPLSATKITVTVLDDEGVPVGAVATSVHQIEGAGTVIGGPGMDAMTSDGQVSFTYLAPSSASTAVFRVTAGTANVDQIATSIVVTVGEMAAEEPPAPTESAVSLDLSAGGDYYSVPANSVPTTASALFDGTSVSVAWKWENGSWTSYILAIGSTDFLVTSGDILWIVAGSAETVGG